MIRPDWDTNAGTFAANNLAKHLQSIQTEMDGVLLNKDVEPVHRMRVSSRRLRNALETFSFCFSEKYSNRMINNIKKMAASLGNARDADVQILNTKKYIAEIDDRIYAPGLRRVLLRLRQRRLALQNKVIHSIELLTKFGDLEEFSQKLFQLNRPDPSFPLFSMPLYRLGWENIMLRLQSFLSFEIFISDLENVDELHTMRIASKNLRYSLEIFAPIYTGELKPFLDATRQTQELLGIIHDSIVWQAYLTNFLDKEKIRAIKFYGTPRGIPPLEPGINYLLQKYTGERLDNYNIFCNSWRDWKDSGLWQSLVETIKTPIIN